MRRGMDGLVSLKVYAQIWPVRPIRYIVPFPAGGGSDVTSRAVAHKLSELWGQQVVVDNRPGAAKLLSTDLAAKAPTDGYTLLMPSASYAINPYLQKKIPYETLKDHAPITQVTQQPYLLVIHPGVAARNVKECYKPCDLLDRNLSRFDDFAPDIDFPEYVGIKHFRFHSSCESTLVFGPAPEFR